MTVAERFAFAPLAVFVLCAAINSVGLLFGIPVGAYSMIIAFAAVALCGALRDRRMCFAACAAAVLMAVTAPVFANIWDFSYDGMYFHKEAAYSLANGWNPFAVSYRDFGRFGHFFDMPLWLDNYPKGMWAVYASMYDICGKIEAAKCVNLLFLIPLFASAYDTAVRVFEKRKIWAFLCAAAFLSNAVILSQTLTFMNDLPVAALCGVCILSGVKIYAGKADTYDYATLACAFAASFSVKFTAPVFCGAILAAYGIAFAAKNRCRGILKPCAVVIISAAVGVCVLGADPYIKHIAQGKNPCFPVVGEGKYDIMNTNPPAGFDGMPNPKKAAVSLFSAARANAGASAELKIPFTVSAEEIDAVAAPDVRVSGFGVLFGGIMLLSLVAAVLTRFKNAAPVMPAIAVLTLLWLFFPETWWARYNPYLYYVPCLIALFIGKNAVSAGLCVLLAANGLISGAAVCNRFTEKTAAARSCFEQIRAVQPVLLRINDFPSHAVWFEEQVIEFELASEPLDAPQIFYQTTKFEPRAGVEK